MPLQGFVDGQDPKIGATWLNKIDAFYTTLFSSATAAADARAALAVPSTSEALLLTGGTLSGPLNLASSIYNTNSATPDIWTSQANTIRYSNLSTVTGFAGSPLTGATRTLHCQVNSVFTASATLLIRGVSTGTTITVGAGGTVNVRTMTPTVFLLEYSCEGSFVASATGFTTGVTATWYYTVMNGVVNISGHEYTLTGTSNTTAFTVPDIPIEITPATNRVFTGLTIVDNTAYVYTGWGVIANTSIFSLFVTAAGTTWTASGTKALITNSFTYML